MVDRLVELKDNSEHFEFDVIAGTKKLSGTFTSQIQTMSAVLSSSFTGI